MNIREFISEERAASMAGVSPKTLLRFAEAGYLQMENDPGGTNRYLASEVKDLFGIMDQTFYDKLAEDLSQDAAPSPAPTTAVVEQTYSAEVVDSPQSLVWDDEPKQVEQTVTHVETSAATTSNEANVALKAELLRLRNLMQLQEKILDLKDQQIEKLSQECSWFKTRIEKAEQKGERDQLLLLSESQTVRRLVMIQESRRSPFRAALEWLGVVNPPTLAIQDRPAIDGQ